MDKSTLASIGERLKAGGTQMGRTISLKVKEMKDLLQTPTPESRIVDQSTSPTLESPDWGLNLRICSQINAEELSGAEIVKAIKKKINNGGNGDAKGLRLALELLEACAMNCEKVFSEIASEKVVEDMVVKLIENPQADRECQVRAMELIRAWGETEELSYLPVFRQTYENLKRRSMSSQVEDGSFPPVQYSLESYTDEHEVSPPESYPIPGSESNGAADAMLPYNYGNLSSEQKKEFLEITKNSLEVLSSLLSSEADPKVIEDDLTMNMLDKCKDSQPVLQRIVQSTNDDESLLFEALNLNDELQKIISKFEEMQVSRKPDVQNSEEPKEFHSVDAQSPPLVEAQPPPLVEATVVNKPKESPEVETAKPAAADLDKGEQSSNDKK
ncbi:TOM1-like protein 2 [Chenopodium quinoa]|uniref:TOM1-like protein 2 n=1 Tax=Chenopodium quinoa TaxID=63459 RepID=A0A803LFA9_CHEQI|nr:TOM1-like protein 2 [Chenopodium quinoa]